MKRPTPSISTKLGVLLAVQERGWLERSLASASAEVAKWSREKQEAMRVHPGGADLDTTLAALEGALAGWRMRAALLEAEQGDLLAEQERRDADHEHAVAHLQQLFENERDRAYTAGRRDGRAVAAHQHELARDVLRAVNDYVLDREPQDVGAIWDAHERWVAAGRPGLGGER